MKNKKLLTLTMLTILLTLGYTSIRASENHFSSEEKNSHNHQMMNGQNHENHQHRMMNGQNHENHQHHHRMMNHDNHNQNNNLHENHDHQRNNQGQYQALLTPLTPLKAQQKTSLEIRIKDANNNLVNEFETFQEYPMHLIAVSDDLEIFKHVHPSYQGNGLFTVDLNFPKGGKYTLFPDFKPVGQSEIVKTLNIEVQGESINHEIINFERQKTIDNTQINVSFSEPKIEAKKDLIVSFNLYNNDGQAIQDLEPYLGEKGHLVIIQKTDNLTPENYLHAHAIENESDNEVKFMTNFPEPGKYKIWGQFQRNGKNITADFWVNVD